MIMYDIVHFQYGLVIGISNLAGFLAAPFIGTLGSKHVGVKQLFIVSSFAQFACGVLFGLVILIDKPANFLFLSYLLRYGHAYIKVLLF